MLNATVAMMLSRTFWSLALLITSVVAQTCSSTNPCEIGCCNEWGNCGFGPDCEFNVLSKTPLAVRYGSSPRLTRALYGELVCGSGTCVSNCDRKSECNPGYGAQWAEKDKCPLNVCCSKHGFCGVSYNG